MRIESLIRFIREKQVILDTDLAMLYGVETRRLNEQVRRNTERFPEDFMFQLTKDEALSSRSQFAILKSGRIMKKIIVMVVTMLPVIYWKVSTK
ncbi:MAG: ORF6N domain-containing protein [Prevotella sp.]|nr:ORF6N domain-containing protein [Prevotella sp.]